MNSLLSKNLSRFRLITFDVTDTLLHFSKAPAEQYKETAETFGLLTLDRELALAAFKPCFKELSQRYPNYGRGSEIDYKTWWITLVGDVLRKSSTSTLDEKKLQMAAEHLVKLYETSSCWRKFEAADELITSIKGAKKHVGVISNFDPRLSVLLSNMNLPQFDFVLTSYESVMKPDRGIFQEALRRSHLKGIQPSEALHIGNKLDLDYNGAKEAGWCAVLIDQQSTNDHCYKSLKEFLQTLQTKELSWT